MSFYFIQWFPIVSTWFASSFSFEIDKFCVINPHFISCNKIILPWLHIKLGLFKQFIKHCLATGKVWSTFTIVFLLYLERKQLGGFVGRPQGDSICKDDLTVWPNSIDNIIIHCLCFSVCSNSFKWICFSKAICGSNSYWWFVINRPTTVRKCTTSKVIWKTLSIIISDQHGKKINQTMCKFEARYNGKEPMALLTDFL